jgi:hypothetical protein
LHSLGCSCPFQTLLNSRLDDEANRHEVRIDT